MGSWEGHLLPAALERPLLLFTDPKEPGGLKDRYDPRLEIRSS